MAGLLRKLGIGLAKGIEQAAPILMAENRDKRMLQLREEGDLRRMKSQTKSNIEASTVAHNRTVGLAKRKEEHAITLKGMTQAEAREVAEIGFGRKQELQEDVQAHQVDMEYISQLGDDDLEGVRQEGRVELAKLNIEGRANVANIKAGLEAGSRKVKSVVTTGRNGENALIVYEDGGSVVFDAEAQTLIPVGRSTEGTATTSRVKRDAKTAARDAKRLISSMNRMFSNQLAEDVQDNLELARATAEGMFAAGNSELEVIKYLSTGEQPQQALGVRSEKAAEPRVGVPTVDNVLAKHPKAAPEQVYRSILANPAFSPRHEEAQRRLDELTGR